MLRFRRLKNRIHAFVLSLLAVILVLVVVLVYRANLDNAREQIMSDIRANGEIFISALAETRGHLRVAARLLSSDYAFKRAFATHEHGTILSAMRNHLDRLERADVMFLLDIDDGSIIADSRANGSEGGEVDEAVFEPLLYAAEDDDYLEADRFVRLGEALYQFIVVPLLAPDPSAWIVIGFRIDDGYVHRFSELSRSQLSICVLESGRPHLLASTLGEGRRVALNVSLAQSPVLPRVSMLSLGGEQYVSHFRPVDGGGEVVALLQRSLDEALRPYLHLQFILAVVFAVAMLAALVGSGLLARSVAGPILSLAGFARRVQAGDYQQRLEVKSEDEVATLGHAFNHMVQGLEEKEQVRNLLGKVVSPEIAHELIHNGVELGGEEKEVSVLFSDLRNFTALCEGRGASEILALLNLYLNEMSEAVEQHGGVVDKYIGDAMMALYGAPLASPDDAANAVATALRMKELLVGVNADFAERGLPAIDIGIGINTDVVVAGNMGSANRLNYTVIGDGVNLASRLEGLTKFYGLKLLVSEAVVARAPGFDYREIDRVRVKGKNEPITIYEPYREEPELVAGLEAYRAALAAYKACNWEAAAQGFAALCESYPDTTLYAVYLRRCRALAAEPPGPEWDGVYTFQSK